MRNRYSPVCRAVILRRVDPDRRMARFCALMIERDLFGTVRLVRAWGRIGTQGREFVQVFDNEFEARKALEVVARAKRKRGYRDL